MPPFCLGYALRRGLKRPTNVFGLAKGGESRNGRSNFNNPRFSRQNPVAPALAGAYRAFRFRPTDVMWPSLRWSDGIWGRAPRFNELCMPCGQHYFPLESRVINIAARFA